MSKKTASRSVPTCHELAEAELQHESSFNQKEYADQFAPDRLYNLVGSSYDLAYEASLKLFKSYKSEAFVINSLRKSVLFVAVCMLLGGCATVISRPDRSLHVDVGNGFAISVEDGWTVINDPDRVCWVSQVLVLEHVDKSRVVISKFPVRGRSLDEKISSYALKLQNTYQISAMVAKRLSAERASLRFKMGVPVHFFGQVDFIISKNSPDVMYGLAAVVPIDHLDLRINDIEKMMNSFRVLEHATR